MKIFEQRLSSWKKMYDDLEAQERALRESIAVMDDQAIERSRKEVERLKVESDAALKAVHEALKNIRAG